MTISLLLFIVLFILVVIFFTYLIVKRIKINKKLDKALSDLEEIQAKLKKDLENSTKWMDKSDN